MNDRRIESVGQQCDIAAKASQDAWERNDRDTAIVADRAYYKAVRLYHALILRKSIDLGLTHLRPEDQELLDLLR